MKICPVCGKKFKDNTRPKNKIFCSENCRKKYFNMKKINETIINPRIYFPIYNYLRNEDIDRNNKEFKRNVNDKESNQNLEYKQNDKQWGLGESNLLEYPMKNKTQEKYLIKKEIKRIFSRKKNH